MHIEPGIVNGAKIALGAATGVASFGMLAKLSYEMLKENGFLHLGVRALICTIAVFSFFQILPHFPVGVSEVHFIFASSLFLLFGAPAAGIGLAAGLAIQGIFFAPTDLPQYGMNVTILLVPLFAIRMVAERIISPNTAYVDITYKQALKISATYQAGVVAWVAFWAFYGLGFTTEAFILTASFGVAYLMILLVEPLVDLGLLALAKRGSQFLNNPFFNARLFAAK